jgi:tripartite-type tricarboxylate transporter receptor subunit TctC
MFAKLKYGAFTVALAMGVFSTGPAMADAISDFYKGRTVTLVFGFGVGGTYGKYSLTLAEFLSKHIPGNPKIVAQSMPGAGGLKATNYAYNVMAKDGSALFMPPDSLVISQLLRPKKVRYDATKFTWLGTVIQSNSVIVVRSDAGISKLSDLRSKQVIMASTGKGSQTFLIPQLVNAVYGAKFKIVMGYKGSRGSQYAMEQGEAQGVSLTWLAWKTGKPHWFEKGFAKPVVQNGFVKEPDLADVPMLIDVVKNEDHKKIVRFMATLSPIGRGLAVPPGVPAARVAALRMAFQKTVADPEFIAAAERRRLRVNAASGEEIQKIVTDSMDVPAAVVRQAQKMIMGK